MIRTRHSWILSLVTLSLFGLSACSNDPVMVPTPPVAAEGLQLVASPPRAEGSGFSITFSWNANQNDGSGAFEWAVGFSRGSDRFQPLGALEWTRTNDDHVLLHFDEDAGTQWVGTDPRSRTFYVRQVGADGAETLATQELSFTPVSLAPEVHFVLPELQQPNSCLPSGRNVVLGWQASDADSKGLVPESVRYMLLRVGGLLDNCLTEAEYLATDPMASIATDDPRWSAWTPYDPKGDFHGAPAGVELVGLEVGSSYLVAVQARDKEGSTSRQFRWNREVRHFRVGVDEFPLLTITENNLAFSKSFVGTSTSVALEVVSGQPLSFSWRASADDYLGTIEAYRYGWDIADLNNPNDPGWAVDWGSGPTWQSAAERSFASGAHTFVVQTRDNSGTVSRGVLELSARTIPSSRRPLLLVDDVEDVGIAGPDLDDQQDMFWNDVLGSILPDFDPNRDVIDAQSQSSRLTLQTLLGYEAVVWYGNRSSHSFLHQNFAPTMTGQDKWNWLEAYQAYGGNLLLTGAGVISSQLPQLSFFLEPVVLDDPSGGQLGFGVEDVNGTRVPRGTLQWAYRSFCVESFGAVRPVLTLIFGEQPGQPIRNTTCDAVHTAMVDAAFGAASVVDLVPAQDRLDLAREFHPPFEEFYNANPTSRITNLVERDCVTVMFRARTRRGAGVVVDESTCPPLGSTESSLEGVPIGLMSSARSATKPRVGSHDFLWGFNPITFTEASVAPALYWIFAQDWGLAATAP